MCFFLSFPIHAFCYQMSHVSKLYIGFSICVFPLNLDIEKEQSVWESQQGDNEGRKRRRRRRKKRRTSGSVKRRWSRRKRKMTRMQEWEEGGKIE